jgi:solute carrier family 25 phosphate transporter 23/24/25/41
MNGEKKDERDARIRSLWQKLDTKKKGNVDLAALKAGLANINHRQ